MRIGLAEGRWPLSQAAFRFYTDESAQWFGGIQVVPRSADHALVAGVAVLGQEWQRRQGGTPTTEGRQIAFAEAASALLLWRYTRSHTIGFVLGKDFLGSNWLGLPGLEVERNLKLALTGPGGRVVLGESPTGQRATRTRIRADRKALAQALWNLLDNAAKYSPRDSVIQVRMEVTPAALEISVRDQGAGIEKHEKKAIFSKIRTGSLLKTVSCRRNGSGPGHGGSNCPGP